MKNKEDKIIVFGGKKIRRIWHNDEWWFSVVDIVEVLTDSVDSKDYWYRLKKRELESTGIELSTFCRQLKLESLDGKKYLTDCANTKSIFRIIQSVPSKKAEPFKRWLAKIGYERIQEIENPELAHDRAKEYYNKKGYPKSWIEKRIRGIAIRQELTDEWKNRGIEENRDFAILTNEIAKATFGLSIKEHKEIKDLDTKFENQNLRDHMTDLELIFSMLGEASTTEIAKSKNVLGFEENEGVAKEGGEIAGKARKNLEMKTGRKIVSERSFFGKPIKKKKGIKIISK